MKRKILTLVIAAMLVSSVSCGKSGGEVFDPSAIEGIGANETVLSASADGDGTFILLDVTDPESGETYQRMALCTDGKTGPKLTIKASLDSARDFGYMGDDIDPDYDMTAAAAAHTDGMFCFVLKQGVAVFDDDMIPVVYIPVADEPDGISNVDGTMYLRVRRDSKNIFLRVDAENGKLAECTKDEARAAEKAFISVKRIPEA